MRWIFRLVEGSKLCLAGGNSNNGANSGLVYANSNNAFANANANRVARNEKESRLKSVSFPNHDLTGKRCSSYDKMRDEVRTYNSGKVSSATCRMMMKQVVLVG